MPASPLPGIDVDQVRRPVFSVLGTQGVIDETAPHRHIKAQMLCVLKGSITIRTEDALWLVPSHCALWLPAGTVHSGKASGPTELCNLFIREDLAASLNETCGVLLVPPLLRELILRLDCRRPPDPRGTEREARLVPVLLDEIRAAPMAPVRLPMPHDRRLRRLATILSRNPASRRTLSEWSEQVGMSDRTLTRLFQRETGMSFARWRQQAHVAAALQRLAAGDLVMNVATDLGYESTSAFIAMFRRILGTTPARYFSTRDPGAAPAADRAGWRDRAID
ncbi:AraC family transcriptional regulator [Gluconacetobacter sacchari]|uniref:Helix-turn-helix transcriptional regulator n=2 Tax=Gluconacetobacter sacchari TaxID=92759 RepID=A0A7W4IFK2_9PROT|nr:helix-turn-helix transcriptional regulator [Gluconacetobacter sacchari]MBB2161887.1 helix-turn-helix transcriptional regulator [Gluconacetobacter sacchari]GBQ22224.1 AraC family transcriptional regulator [Gluconacetobacter sacchari DSM 12717]